MWTKTFNQVGTYVIDITYQTMGTSAFGALIGNSESLSFAKIYTETG